MRKPRAKHRASLRKGPGRFRAKTDREWTLIQWAHYTAIAQGYLIDARSRATIGGNAQQLLQFAREWGAKARAQYQQLKEGRAAR